MEEERGERRERWKEREVEGERGGGREKEVGERKERWKDREW